MSDQTSKKKTWDKAIVVLVPLGVTAIVVGFYAWLWHVAFFQNRSLDTFGPDDLAKFGLLGDSFGFLTCLFAAMAFGFSWLTNRSQSEELRLQREELMRQRIVSEAQLRASAEAAYAQRMHSLRIESKDFRGHLRSFSRAHVSMISAWAKLRPKLSLREAITDQELKKVLTQTGTMNKISAPPFENSDVHIRSHEAWQLGMDASRRLSTLATNMCPFPVSDSKLEECETLISEALACLNDMADCMAALNGAFHKYYGLELERLTLIRGPNLPKW